MDTALEFVRIILEYFGWEGDEIEVSLCCMLWYFHLSVQGLSSGVFINLLHLNHFHLNLRCYFMEAEDSGMVEEASFVESAENWLVISSRCSPNAASFERSAVACHWSRVKDHILRWINTAIECLNLIIFHQVFYKTFEVSASHNIQHSAWASLV